jgi:dihydroorotate dehydrogenase
MTLYPLLRPLIFRLGGEQAHRLTIATLRMLPAGRPPEVDPLLATEVAGLRFANPVGLAAGFDKDAEVYDRMPGLGFGFTEVGTLTPLPQAGNRKPRLFRLGRDEAIINRLGFNNGGQAAALGRLQRGGRNGLVGVNLGANKDSADRIADYCTGVRAMGLVADYLTINISSPNTPGLRALQDAGALDALLVAVMAERGEAGPPIFLKIAPDLDRLEIDDIARISLDRGVDGLIVCNTTVSRPPLRSSNAGEVGGLSGAPLGALALQRLRDVRAATGGAVPLIAVGGIGSGEDAYRRIRAGASLVQLYTALVYRGPGLARQITRDLRGLLLRDGFANVRHAIGTT